MGARRIGRWFFRFRFSRWRLFRSHFFNLTSLSLSLLKRRSRSYLRRYSFKAQAIERLSASFFLCVCFRACSKGAFVSARDGSITKSDVKARLVRYVFSDFFGRKRI